mmetsp:Transcript_5417/g.10830  ORF Transcript_5417/g.10830 Transcript_5417/m.10830 type:complete len:333 (+) Transcript_5417:260-1258(+)
MFKKRKISKNKSLRTSQSSTQSSNTNNQHVDEEEEEEESVLSTITSTKSRRLILSAQTRGVSSTSLLKSNASSSLPSEEGDGDDMIMNKSLGERLKDNFGGAGGEDEASVLEAKHEKAMREYIMQGMIGKGRVEEARAMKEMGEREEAENKNGGIKSKADVFNDLKSQLVTSKGNDGSQDESSDMGHGGAILGGTGIAEVILPKQVRRKNVSDTIDAIEEDRIRRREKRLEREDMGIAAVAGPGGSYNGNFQKHQKDWFDNNSQAAARKEVKEKREVEKEQKREERVDDGRKGFKNSEDKERVEKYKGKALDRDGQFVKNFMKRTAASMYRK